MMFPLNVSTPKERAERSHNMATSTALHLGVTAVGGTTLQAYQLPNINWATDWSKVGGAANSTLLASVISPYDAQTRLRVSTSPVANVYAGTGVDPSYMLPTKRGVSMLVQLNLVASVTDSADPKFRADLPISCHVVMKLPMSGYLTESDLEAVLQATFASFYGTNVGTVANGLHPYANRISLLNRLAGGITTPPGVL